MEIENSSEKTSKHLLCGLQKTNIKLNILPEWLIVSDHITFVRCIFRVFSL